MRYFLLDRIVDLRLCESARGVKNVTFTDEVLHDHFPDMPVYPAALLIESAAQLSGALIEFSENTSDESEPLRALLVQVERARFVRFVEPGDQVIIDARIEERMETTFRVAIQAAVNSAAVAEMQLTFVLKQAPSERIHEQRRALYAQWTKTLPTPPVIR